MNLRWFRRAFQVSLVSAAIVCASAAVSAQQTVGSGAIEGRAIDQSGGTLPGVTVTATSPALQLPQVAQITNAEGNYRFVDLPAGVYQLTFELPGFQRVIRSDLRLNVGFVARIDAELRVGGIEETITVSGQGPLVDLATTTANTNFTKEMLSAVPTTRSMWQVLGMTPGVRMTTLDVGGNMLGTQQGYKNYGTDSQNTPQIEGVNARLGAGSAMGFFDYQTFEEVQVAGVGNDASVATPGVNLVAIVKSGGNAFHGSYLAGGSSDKFLQSDNLDDALRAQGVRAGSPLRYVYDFAGDLGGRIVRDKLWFYGAVREQKRVQGLIGYAKAPGPDREYGTADDVPGEPPLTLSTQTTKISFQPSSRFKVIGFYSRALKADLEAGASRFRPFETTADRHDPHVQWKGELQGALNPQTLFTIVQGYAYYSTNYDAQPGVDYPGNPSRLDRATGIYSGARHLQDIRPRARWQSQGTFSYFPDSFLGGAHSFKLGYQIYREKVGTSYENKPSGNYLLIYDRIGGVRQPVEIDTYNFPIVDPFNRERAYSAYATDSWRIGERLTANLGLRWDRYRVFVDEQTKEQGPFGNSGTFPAVEVITRSAVAPRVGLAYSLGTKTVVKGTYGLFNHAFTEDLAGSFNPNTLITTTYRWRDQDGNGDYTPGEVNLAGNGPDFLRVSGASNNVLNPDLRLPRTHEVSLALEREVSPTLSVKTLYVYKQEALAYEAVNIRRPYSAYNIPITRRDPGPDGLLNTSDDGGRVTFYDYAAAYRGSAFVANQFQNRADDRDDAFHTLELTANKRMSANWDMLASFAATRNHRWLNGIASNPNSEFFPLDETWDWVFKLSGSYTLPRGFLASAFFQHLAGAPGQRTYIFRTADPDGGAPISQSGTITLRLEPFGSVRSPHQNVLNLRASKRFRLGGARQFEVMADLFNALNSNAATSVTYAAGPSYGLISGILPPRVVRLGATFSF